MRHLGRPRKVKISQRSGDIIQVGKSLSDVHDLSNTLAPTAQANTYGRNGRTYMHRSNPGLHVVQLPPNRPLCVNEGWVDMRVLAIRAQFEIYVLAMLFKRRSSLPYIADGLTIVAEG